MHFTAVCSSSYTRPQSFPTCLHTAASTSTRTWCTCIGNHAVPLHLCVCVHLTCTPVPNSTRPLHSTRCPARARVRSDHEGIGRECGFGRQGGCAELEGERQEGRNGSWGEGDKRGISYCTYFLHSRHPTKLLESSSFGHLKRKSTYAVYMKRRCSSVEL